MTLIYATSAEDISTKGKKSFGMNPHHVTYYTAFRFLNIMKHAGPWNNDDVVDVNGYPAQAGTFTVPIHAGNHADHSGTYTVTWDGTGSLTVGGSGVTWHGTVSAPAWNPGATNVRSFTLDGTNSDNGILTVVNGASGFVNNIQIVNDAYATEYGAGEVLIPWCKTAFAGYETLRFMFWSNALFGARRTWDQRSTLDTYSWQTLSGYKSATVDASAVRGVPYEVLIRIANDAAATLWLCVPHAADDTYISNLSALVKANLDPGLLPLFELGNEVWNPSYPSPHAYRVDAQVAGWLPDEMTTSFLDDFSSGFTFTGASIVSTNTVTEDTSTGAHYMQGAVTFGASEDSNLIVKIDPASTAPGVRLVLHGDSGGDAEIVVDLSGPTIVSDSGTSTTVCKLDGDGNVHLEVAGVMTSGSGYFRIHATDGSFGSSYTGTSKTVIVVSAYVCKRYNTMYADWFGKRSAEMTALIAAEFGSDRAYRTAICWQAGQPETSSGPLTAAKWQAMVTAGRDPGPYVRPATVHHMLGIGPYFGNISPTTFSTANCNAMWAAWVANGGDVDPNDPDAWQAIKDVIIAGTPGSLTGCLVDSTNVMMSKVTSYASIAATEGMLLIAYEAGNHAIQSSTVNDLYSGGSIKSEPAAAINAAMFSVETGYLWTQMLDHWKASGGTIWANLTDVMPSYVSVGFFGVRTKVGVDNAVSDAIDAWRAANPRWWVH